MPTTQLQRALDAQAHRTSGADAERAQVVRQLVGAPVQLARR